VIGEETLFAGASALAPADRASYLDQQCAADADLRARVEALLAAHDRAAGILDVTPRAPEPTDGDAATRVPVTEPVGSSVGPYKLLELIGEGGMGAVYMAEQQRPVRRTVALKLIKPGMDTKQAIARFEAERQALALMDHPNIAKVLDAGSTDAGRLYFVMELVKGVPITDYCDANKLTPRRRLDLFVQACQAVQHAHQKGIIHRDLKPTNILVTLHDGVPVPKIIDFGIAKATNGNRLTDLTLYTNFNQIVGTPLYMSPEQAELSGLDVDTRSDVYSLGVMLYELLTGTTPFDKARLGKAAYDEIRRIIRDEEPPKPSTRMSTLGGTLNAVSTNRGTEPKKLGPLVRGELDWIVMKALEKDRTRRYDSASDLARDVRRHLDDEPVEACAPSAIYRFRKFARRNRGVLTTFVIAGAFLLGGTALSTWLAVRARTAEQRALTEARNAKASAAVTDAINEFINGDLLGAVKFDMGLASNPTDLGITVKTAIDRAAAKIEERFPDEPDVQAHLHATLGNAYRSLGDYDSSLRHLERAVQLERSLFGPESRQAMAFEAGLVLTNVRLCRFEEAERISRRLLDTSRRRFGDDDPDTLGYTYTLGGVDNLMGRHAAAEPLLRKALEKSQRSSSGTDESILCVAQLAITCFHLGRLTEAEALLRQVLDKRHPALTERHPMIIEARYCLAQCFARSDRDAEAEAMLNRVVESANSVWGKCNPLTCAAQVELGIIFLRTNRLAAGEAILRRSIDEQSAEVGGRKSQMLDAMQVLGACLSNQGRLDEAKDVMSRAHEIGARVLPQGDCLRVLICGKLATLCEKTGRHDEAATFFEETMSEYRRARELETDIPKNRRNELAGFLGEAVGHIVTEPNPSAADALRAVNMAKCMVELAPEERIPHLCLGCSLYRTGDCKSAVTSLEKAVSLTAASADPIGEGLLLAMAHEQLGDHATALAWYTASCLWQNEEVQTDPDVEARRFRAEAAELLAVPVEWPPAEWRAGEADLRLRARLDKSNPSRTSLSALQDLAVARRAESTEPAGPFGSAPALIPGIIQAEDFDRGGEGVAYHDVSYVGMHNRNPEPYRITGVDLEVCNDEGGGMHVGHVQPGEWLTYTVDVKEAGAYDLGLRVSTIGPAALYVEVDCKDVTGPFELPNTGGWDKWETLTKRQVHLEAGKRVIRVVFDRSDTGFVCNFNWLRLTASVPPG